MKAALVYSDKYLDHHTGSHPERADRLRAVQGAVDDWNLRDKLFHIAPGPAPDDALLAVHEPDHLSYLERFCRQGGGNLSLDTVAGPDSYDIAVLAAGGAIGAVDYCLAGQGPVFAAVRPPGHHATAGMAMGFCLINNVAVAAAYARSHHKAERVFVFDWDLHHGNGTEQIFYSDCSVLYCSIHEYPAYPGTGPVTDTGRHKGTGYTVNVPVPSGSGDSALLTAVRDIVIPVCAEYKPDLVICSAGFDAHVRDPLGGLTCTARGWYEMLGILGQAVNEICPGRMVMMLEGGYDLAAIGLGTAAILGRMTGHDITLPDEGTYEAPAAMWKPAVEQAREAASVQWRL